MPQMKPLIWLAMMIATLIMTLATMIINFFTETESPEKRNSKKVKSTKWKW